MGLKQIAEAAGSPVSVEQARVHIGVESEDWDSMIEAFINAATRHAENVLGKAIGEQTWELSLDAFTDEIELPFGPVTEIVSVSYCDASRSATALPAETYILDLVSTPQRLVLDPEESWPETASVPNAVTVRFTTGYQVVPAPITQAILMIVGHWWSQRESVNVGNIVTEVPMGASMLLTPYRRIIL